MDLFCLNINIKYIFATQHQKIDYKNILQLILTIHVTEERKNEDSLSD